MSNSTGPAPRSMQLWEQTAPKGPADSEDMDVMEARGEASMDVMDGGGSGRGRAQ